MTCHSERSEESHAQRMVPPAIKGAAASPVKDSSALPQNDNRSTGPVAAPGVWLGAASKAMPPLHYEPAKNLSEQE